MRSVMGLLIVLSTTILVEEIRPLTTRNPKLKAEGAALPRPHPYAPAAKDVHWLVAKLRYDGDQLYKQNQHDAAAKYLALGLQLAPDDNDLRRRSGWAGKTGGVEQLETQIANATDDFELRLQRDHALAAQRKCALAPMLLVLGSLVRRRVSRSAQPFHSSCPGARPVDESHASMHLRNLRCGRPGEGGRGRQTQLRA